MIRDCRYDVSLSYFETEVWLLGTEILIKYAVDAVFIICNVYCAVECKNSTPT